MAYRYVRLVTADSLNTEQALLGRNTASLAFKSRLAFSIGIVTRDISRSRFVRRRNANEKCRMYSDGKSETRFERE